MKKKASGILLHITSLPSKYGIGDLGPRAYKFADFLAQAGQRYWQTLPLNPPSPMGYSPYNCLSAFAGNNLLISPDMLYRQGLLNKSDIHTEKTFPQMHVEFEKVVPHKMRLLNRAYENFKTKQKDDSYDKFCRDNENWLEDYAVFIALRERYQNRSWCDWPNKFRDRNKQAMNSAKAELKDIIEREKFFQYVFFNQYGALKSCCKGRNIKIIGDVPIYVSHDSADVWAHPEIFKLTKSKRPRFVSGVPPDAFSPKGQLWGNPVYRWKILTDTKYWWWLRRMAHNLGLFDMIRLDHFRGFVFYWQVRAGEKTAEKGRWIKVPSEDFFNHLINDNTRDRIIVEDLGYITADVRAIIEKFGLAGMKILTFGLWGDPKKNPHGLQNHTENSVVYTGTHDTNTARGWFEKEASREQKKILFDLIGHKVSAAQIHWEMIKLAFSSKSKLAIVPMQDVLGLGAEARMNLPATTKNNWVWRFLPSQVRPKAAQKLVDLASTYGRTRG